MTTPLEMYRQRRKLSYEDLAWKIYERLSFMAERAPGTRTSPGRSLVRKWALGNVQPSLEWALAIRALCGRSVPLSSLLVRR